MGKFEDLRTNYSSIRSEIQSTIDEINQCLEIIDVRDDDDGDVCTDGGEEKEEEFVSMELREIRSRSLKEGRRVRENSENWPVFDAIRELYKLLVSRHLVSVQDWISVLVRVDVNDDKRFRDVALKEFIDFRILIRSVKKKCDELGCVLDEKPVSRGGEEEEEDLWEEGKIEAYSVENANKEKGKGKNVDTGSCSTSKNNSESHSSSTSLRSKLIAEAPVVDWSLSLDDWGSNRDALANQRGLELDSHWGRVDPDAVIPAEKIAELRLHCTVYKEETTEIQPCLAPLRKGGLCQRRDMRICPFHGPIVPRDAKGNPIEQKREETPRESEREGSVEATDEFLDLGDVETFSSEKLAKQAVKNVRERDREAVNAMKRAKLAKIREHNEAVLRESAIASTSYSENFGENQDPSSVQAKKPTLASMLKKKVTTKDRLAKRLLNTRARDSSSRQVTQGEDSKYREAFPNQW
ncbi:uncharacterized protein A4U43_C08F21880 [Asparagus officinalis]|nr:uncharacterized protein A4U43_C08F21880 [Asparagus officinalis]